MNLHEFVFFIKILSFFAKITFLTFNCFDIYEIIFLFFLHKELHDY